MKTYTKIRTKGRQVRQSLIQKWYSAVQRYGARCRNVYVRAWTT